MEDADINKVYHILNDEVKKYKVPVVDLVQMQTRDPFKVLVTTILSSRTNDRTTADAAKRFFLEVNDLSSLKRLGVDEINQLIFPVGFHNSKARHLAQLPLVIDNLFDGKIPETVDNILKLPGVGRKTANLVVAVAFKKPAICVDTHVHRISNRLGYVKTKTPLETEMVLRKKLPKKYWIGINSILVAFGQNTCRPIAPKCSICPVYNCCKRIGVEKKR